MMDLLTQAKVYASRKHVWENKQEYGNILPYTHHLDAVERVLRRFGEERQFMLAAAWLHDVIEDTRGKGNEVRARDIEELFGEDVATVVAAVTTVDGPNRKTRNALTYPQIREGGEDAIRLKLADRIANVEFGGRGGTMYVKEHPEFRLQLRISAMSYDDRLAPMWNHLDKLITELGVQK